MEQQIKQQNQNQNIAETQKRYILDPYRTLGSFVSGKITLSQTQPISLAVPTNTSYKIYSDSLAIKVVSPPLTQEVQCVISYNEYSYVKTGNHVIKMKYHHIVKEWELPQEKNIHDKCKFQQSILMKFDNLLVLGQGESIYIIDEQQDNLDIQVFKAPIQFRGMIHPVTYINKVVIYNNQKLVLLNPLSRKVLYEYPKLKNYLKTNNLSIITMQSSKLVNIVAISLDNGEIIIFNLKKDEIVFKMKLKIPAICIAFCDQEALMSTGDENGNVVLWDLENKKILYKFQQFIQGGIDSLVFMPGQPVLTCGSSKQNCIRQLRINLEDNRILTLFRQRVGITQSIENIKIISNNELVLSSDIESMFTSMYSHTNNYKLNRVLDSSNQFHIISYHFNIQLFKNQTLQKTFNIHQYAYMGKISLSNKYYLVATRTRLIKLGVSNVQIKLTGIRQFVIFQQHFIYVLTENDFIVLDFVTLRVIKQLKIGKCSKLKQNQFGNLLALYNDITNMIQIYDMQKIQLAREYRLEQQDKQPLCLCFTSDNKYLLSSHDNKLKIWSIIHSNLYKEYIIEKNIIEMIFTPDNQFFLSVYENSRQINIWNNYIGKIISNRSTEKLNFNVKINYCEEDFRKILSKINSNHLKIEEQQQNIHHQQNDQILNQISDSLDQLPEYQLQMVQKWLPLIYYDQIKERNTVQSAKEVSLPFFLDFKNIDEEKKKIQKQIKQDLLNKKKEKQAKIDQHLRQDSHEIILNEKSTIEDYQRCIKMLQSLSVAEIDYQLRTFLLNPSNKHFILKMFEMLLRYQKSKQIGKSPAEFLNIIFHRTLYLISTEMFDNQLKEKLQELFILQKESLNIQKTTVDKCVAITQKMM